MLPVAAWMRFTFVCSVLSGSSAARTASMLPLHVCLDDQVERLDLARLYPGVDLLQRDAVAAAALGMPLALKLFHPLPGRLLIGHAGQDVARLRNVVQSQYLDRNGWPRLFDLLSLVAQHGPDAAPDRSRHHVVAGAQCARLDQHGRNRSLALIDARLDHDTPGHLVGVRLEVGDLCYHQHVLQQVGYALAL